MIGSRPRCFTDSYRPTRSLAASTYCSMMFIASTLRCGGDSTTSARRHVSAMMRRLVTPSSA